MKRQKYFSVRAVSLPAMSATAEDFDRVNEARRGHLQAARALFGNIQNPLVCHVTRDSQHSQGERALGDFVNQATAEHKAEERAEKRKLTDAKRAAAALGVNLPSSPRNLVRVLEGQRRLEEAMRKEAAQ
jgi:nucleotide-binding universal stress UspA family protein